MTIPGGRGGVFTRTAERLVRVVAAAAVVAIPLFNSNLAFAEPPYPRLMTMLWHNPEPKDFARAEKYDAVEFHWTDIVREPGLADSCRAMKARNPDLQVIAVVSCDVNCSNWTGRNDVMYEWTAQLDANAATWYLRDTDGDHWKRADGESTCAEGWMNWTNLAMCRAFAEYLYNDVFIENPGVFDGIHGDHLLAGISWANATRWIAGGVDSIDSNQDGVGDRPDSLDNWWKYGTNEFCERLRGLMGQDFVIFPNGGVPAKSRQWTNGRFHEGFPGPVGGAGPDWYSSMLSPYWGYLNEEDWYLDVPQQLITLQGLSFWPVDCDPQRLSTAEAPNNAACLDPIIKLTLASALLGDGYACITGFGRDSENKVWPYHSTWWFPVYDSLRVNLGQPLGAYYDTIGAYTWQDAYIRQYEGGQARVTYPGSVYTATGFLELRPKAAFLQPVTGTWQVGTAQTIRFRGWDPLDPATFANTKVLLSRNGGASFPETLGVYLSTDTTATFTVTGPASANCRVRLLARDSAGWTGQRDSGSFIISDVVPVTVVAEATPRSFGAGAAVALDAFARLNSAGSGGISQIRLVKPATLASWQAPGAFVNGTPLAGTITTAGDTIRVTSSVPLVAGSVVRVALTGTASPQAANPGAAIAVAVVPWGGGSAIAVPAGNADGIAGNSESLMIAVTPGPLASVVVSPASATVGAGATRQFSASGRDAYGNAVAISPSYSVTDGIGGVTSGGLFTASALGAGAVIASAGGFADSAEVTVVAGAVASIIVSPDSATISADSTIAFSVQVLDALGNPIVVSGAWSVTGGIGTITTGGLFTARSSGRGAIRYSAGGLLDSAGVTVVVGAPSAITVSPEAAIIPADSSGRFTAFVVDADGNARNDAITWTLRGAIGSIDASGNFTPSALGSGWAVASSGALADSASITVVPGAPDRVVISPDSATIDIDAEAVFTAQVFDARGNVLSDSVAWSAEGACVLVGAGRVRGWSAGSGAAIATAGDASDAASVIVIGPPPGSPDRQITIVPPSGLLVVSPAARLDTLRVETRVARGGVPDTTASAGEFVLLLDGGGACAPETLLAQPITGEAGAFAFESAALGGCGEIAFTLAGAGVTTQIAGAATLRSPDVDADGVVDLDDIALFLPDYHDGIVGCSDLDADGSIAGADLDVIGAEFGAACADAGGVAAKAAPGAEGLFAPSTLRIAGTRAADALGIAPPGYDIVTATLTLEGAGGLAAIAFSLGGDGVLLASGPAVGESDLVAYPLGANAGEVMNMLWVDATEAAPSFETNVAQIAFAIPAGSDPESLEVAASIVNAFYGTSAVSGVTWEIASAPDDSTGAPDDSTGAPDDSTGAPDDSTGAPDDSTGAPDDSTGAPDDSTGAPDDSTGAPDDSTGAPDDSTGAPDDSTGAPDDSTGAPDDSTGAPDDSTGAPDDSTGAPDDSTGAPDDSTGAPDDSTGAPDDSTGAPDDSTGAPDDSTGAPNDSTGAPDDSTGAPDDSTGAPIDSTLGIDPPDSTDDDENDPPDDPPNSDGAIAAYKLFPPSPNPALGDVRIRFAVPSGVRGAVRVSLYDSAGRLIGVVADAMMEGGTHEVIWTGEDDRGRPRAGIYFVRLEADGYVENQKAIRIR
ncbi:MAG: hypothetical protein ACKVU1_15600 [bacterium]